jgi:pimeloyl-ACP methyl ester carboxylesterase
MQRFLKYLQRVILVSSLLCGFGTQADTNHLDSLRAGISALQNIQAVYADTFTLNACKPNETTFSTLVESELVVLADYNSFYSHSSSVPSLVRYCAKELRNLGNAPFVLYHGRPTLGVVVLFHGLSDSPFYLESIAQAAFTAGYNVVVGLLPGHGLRENALDVLHDPSLKSIWRQHVHEVISAARPLGRELILGGFSTGGALVTDYALQNTHKVTGLALFSGALRLPANAETLTKFPFAKYIAKWTELSYATLGENPFKYPSISSYAASELMSIIRDIRSILQNNKTLYLPIFVAHSELDSVTPIAGVEELMANVNGEHTFFRLAKSLEVCHDALPLNDAQIALIPQTNKISADSCSFKNANPVHANMLATFEFFLADQIGSLKNDNNK